MIGEEVRRQREGLGLTGAQLAEQAGMAPSAVSQIETGKRTPSSASVIKLAGALGVEVGALYPKAPAPSPELPFNGLEDERREGTPDAPVVRPSAATLHIQTEGSARPAKITLPVADLEEIIRRALVGELSQNEAIEQAVAAGVPA